LKEDTGEEWLEGEERQNKVEESLLLWIYGLAYDQFNRKQVIYPVTGCELGNTYGAEGGALEGDSSRPIHQTYSAVRIARRGPAGCGNFAHWGKLMNNSEVGCSNDHRLFHQDENKVEGLSRVRLRTRAAVGGMANRSKLEAFVLVKEDG